MRFCVAAVVIAVAGLSVPATAGAGVLDTYQRLSARGISPAPLVPTVVPRSLTPIDRTVALGQTRGRGYALRLLRHGADGDAALVVVGGEFRSMRAFLREERRFGFRVQSTRVRGRRGYLLTRRLGPVTRVLTWVERGVVYSVASATPRKVSLAQLRATANGLDRLERDWIGASSDPNNSSEAFAVTTARTVTIHVSFEATCAPPGRPEASIVRVGQAAVTLLRRDGNRFAFDISQNRRGSGAWEGTVTGTIAPTAITLDVRATGTIDGDVCDTGPLTLTLDRRVR